MSKLKPQLIITGSNKKKSSFAGGIGNFVLLVVVFVLGVYVGMRLDNADLDGDMFSKDLKNNVPTSENSTIEIESETPSLNNAKVTESNLNVKDVSSQSGPEGTANNPDTENLELSTINQNSEQLDDSSTVSILGASTKAESNESSSIDLTPSNLPLEDAYRLQVAAFGNLDDANEIVSELKQKGYNAYIVTTPNSRGEVWNLIKIGNFNTAQEAWNFSAEYRNKEGGEVFVESLNKGRMYNRALDENSEVKTLDENNGL